MPLRGCHQLQRLLGIPFWKYVDNLLVDSMTRLPDWLTQYPELQFVPNDDFSTQAKPSDPPSTSKVTDQSVTQEQRIDFESAPESLPVILMGNSQHQSEDRGHSFQRQDVQNLEMVEVENAENLSYRNLSSHSPQGPTSGEGDNSWPLVGRGSLSDDEVGLLKYYSCHVTPWVSVIFL